MAFLLRGALPRTPPGLPPWTLQMSKPTFPLPPDSGRSPARSPPSEILSRLQAIEQELSRRSSGNESRRSSSPVHTHRPGDYEESSYSCMYALLTDLIIITLRVLLLIIARGLFGIITLVRMILVIAPHIRRAAASSLVGRPATRGC